MKYESSILKRLIDTYGVIGNPRYLSEIIKEFIVRGKELYPQLFTYQADWLAHIDEFGLTPEYVVSYTGQQIYAPHTKEKPVKRAILKGNTLVNIVNYSETIVSTSGKYIQISSLVYSPIGKPITLINFSDKVITFQVTANGTFKETVSINANSKTVITLSDGEEIKNIRGSQSNGWEINETSLNELKLGLMVIDGDYTNVDIPYFTGMQSVKMPVLTTSNEDGTKTNILTVNEDVTLRSNGDVCDELDLLTGKLTQRIDEDGEVLVQESVKTVDLTIHDKDQQKVERLTSFEGGTHFTTSSQEGSLLPTITVDVVTDLEETLSLCSMDGNTM